MNYQQTQITSLEAQKSVLALENEKMTSEVHRLKQLPYTAENERLSAELEKNKSKIDKFDEISVQNQQLKTNRGKKHKGRDIER